jgi:hypothetical protein
MIANSLLILITFAVTIVLLIMDDWHWTIFGLSMCYLIGFVLIVQIWPLALAAVKLITGLMGVILLGTVKTNSPVQTEVKRNISFRIFLVLVLSISWIVVTATISKLNEWLPISYTNLYIGLVILFAGIIKFAIGQQSFEIIVGLLVFLSGFDIIYSSLEGSALVTGVYSLIVLSICILGAYLEGSPENRKGME